jgi:hypothetical protein
MTPTCGPAGSSASNVRGAGRGVVWAVEGVDPGGLARASALGDVLAEPAPTDLVGPPSGRATKLADGALVFDAEE